MSTMKQFHSKVILRLGLSLLLFRVTKSLKDGEMELLLVQAIWRHGDRSPTKTFSTDPFQEGNWTFGGGGFGQLSPIGMRQHFNLGKLLRSTYVDTGFLSARYSSKEIYIRSTDLNRTIISAMSNMLGMYGQNTGAGAGDEHYPVESGWPAGYIPIAIHTVDYETDHIGNPGAVCRRQDQLWEMAKSSNELQAFQNRADVLEVLKTLSANCGENIDLYNLWIVQDALTIEQIHANETMRQQNNWYTDALYNQMTEINDQMILYKNGIFDPTMSVNGLDIGLEMHKIRGGSMINDMNMHMNIKLDCLSAASNNAKCKWINGLKYYAYSSHDTTIYSLFAILGIVEKVIISKGYPKYSAATFIELWRNNTDNRPYFKLTYHANDVNVTIYPITQEIDECSGKLYCSLDVFRSYAARNKPDEPMNQWCNVDPRLGAASSLTNLIAALITVSHVVLRY